MALHSITLHTNALTYVALHYKHIALRLRWDRPGTPRLPETSHLQMLFSRCLVLLRVHKLLSVHKFLPLLGQEMSRMGRQSLMPQRPHPHVADWLSTFF